MYTIQVLVTFLLDLCVPDKMVFSVLPTYHDSPRGLFHMLVPLPGMLLQLFIQLTTYLSNLSANVRCLGNHCLISQIKSYFLSVHYSLKILYLLYTTYHNCDFLTGSRAAVLNHIRPDTLFFKHYRNLHSYVNEGLL